MAVAPSPTCLCVQQHFLKQSALSLASLHTMFQNRQGPRIGSHLRAPSEFEVGWGPARRLAAARSTPRFGLCSSKRGQRASVFLDSMPLVAGSPVRRCDATGCGRYWHGIPSKPYGRGRRGEGGGVNTNQRHSLRWTNPNVPLPAGHWNTTTTTTTINRGANRRTDTDTDTSLRGSQNGASRCEGKPFGRRRQRPQTHQ